MGLRAYEPPSLGHRALGPCSLTQVWFLSGGPHCGDKDGDRKGDKEEQKALILLLPWGQGLIPLEGQRQEVEAPGAGFFKTGFILIFIIFSVFP